MDLQELKMNYIIETEHLKLRELTLDDTEKHPRLLYRRPLCNFRVSAQGNMKIKYQTH